MDNLFHVNFLMHSYSLREHALMHEAIWSLLCSEYPQNTFFFQKLVETIVETGLYFFWVHVGYVGCTNCNSNKSPVGFFAFATVTSLEDVSPNHFNNTGQMGDSCFNGWQYHLEAHWNVGHATHLHPAPMMGGVNFKNVQTVDGWYPAPIGGRISCRFFFRFPGFENQDDVSKPTLKFNNHIHMY